MLRRLRSIPRPWSRELLVVLAVGLLFRCVLIPITHGQDFVVWDLATKATLDGDDIYAHHPNYPGGPYAYFPLFLYLELPFQWLAEHTALSFTVLGKLVLVAGDTLAAVLVAAELRERGYDDRATAVGAALVYLNPLVLYDGAYYGRFDLLAAALLLLAIRQLRRRRRTGPLWYGLAVAMKTFPGFAVAGVLRTARGRRVEVLSTLVAVLVLLSALYLTSAKQLAHDIAGHDAVKEPGGLSWQTLLRPLLDTSDIRLFGYVLLALFAVGTLGLLTVRDEDLYLIAVLLSFFVTSKLLLDQYLVWPMPWLAIVLFTVPRLRAATLVYFAASTAVGMLANADIHPWGRSPEAINLTFALLIAAYLGLIVRSGRAQPEAVGPRTEQHPPRSTRPTSDSRAPHRTAGS